MIINYSKSSFVKKYIQKLNIKRKLSSLLEKKKNTFHKLFGRNAQDTDKSILTPLLILALGAWNAALRSCMAGPAGGSRDLYLPGNCRSSGNTVCVQHPVGWRNRGSSRFSAALFLYCVNTKCGVE